MDISDIKELYQIARNMPTTIPGAKPVREGHVFDENKSVKWNRERVEEVNTALIETKRELQRKRNEALGKAHNLVIEYIARKCGSTELAEDIHEFCSMNSDHVGDDEYFDLVEAIADFTEQARNS